MLRAAFLHVLVYPVVVGMFTLVSAAIPVRLTAAELPSDGQGQVDPKGLAFFEREIRPLLIARCVKCHGEEKRESELRVDTWSGLEQGGGSGPAVVPGNPGGSLIVTAIGYQDSSLQMPPDGRLSEAEIRVITDWVLQGAPHPERQSSTSDVRSSQPMDRKMARAHWAFQPLQPVRPPVNETQQATASVEKASVEPVPVAENPIDSFLDQQLRTRGLTPTEKADRYTLLRRVTFDMTGLPPTRHDIDHFINDPSPNAWLKVIDRLLLSPHYGERWGRHWLDVARYADSNGLDENIAHGNAWRYRDYVVDAFNKDKPFDEFVHEQLAGDLLPDRGDIAVRNEHLVATGFLLLGPKVLAEPDEAKMENDIVDEQVDTIGRAFLGMTIGCARCHDHKFDPIDQYDYYGLAGIFKSTHSMDSFTKIARWHENTIATPSELTQHERHQQSIEQLKQQIAARTERAKQEVACRTESSEATGDQAYSDAAKADLAALNAQLDAMQKSVPVLPSAMGAIEGKIADMPIHFRGSHLTLGPVVPRHLPGLLDNVMSSPAVFTGSGRLEFAQWLTDARNPLTPRVFVNRVWRWHFGRGLVPTPDNFGFQGAPPTHPELLDWLARYFIDSGFSVKELHRIILTSSAYQRSSIHDAANATKDPANDWYWRYPSRRLEAEIIRDSMLSVSGQLDRSIGGNLLNVANREFVFNHESKENVNYAFNRRSLYLPVIRNHLYPLFQLFDFNDASTINGDRQTSTVATQALYLMNSPQVEEASEALADITMSLTCSDLERIDWLYMTLYSRHVSTSEIDRAMRYLNEQHAETGEATEAGDDIAMEGRARRDAWKMLSHALLAANEFTFLR